MANFLLTRLISEGKAVAKQGDMQKALDLFKQAFSIQQSPKLESRIKKIEELLAKNDLEDEDDEFVNVNNCGLMLFKELYDKLYDYQRDGVSFLYGLYRDGRKGGVLADDMGLGKTIQIISFLSGMYNNELIRHTLLVMPTSLITNWVKEFSKWTPGMRVKDFHGASKAERTRNLEKVQRRGGVIITTYTMLINNWQQLASYQGKEFSWDYMILDEAHKIKNSSTKTAKSAYAIPSKNRVLLTGTPVQNNLREMWALFDFACQGSLLGTAKTFKTEYENPITRAREKDATPGEKALGSRMSENLMKLIKPCFLRRTKAEVQRKKKDGKGAKSEPENHQDPQDQPTSGAVMPKLNRKNDLIVWTYLSPIQEDIYRQFIGLDHIKELLMNNKSPLAELTILKKLCDHPRLLSANAIEKLGLDDNLEGENSESDVHSIANVSDETLISESGKLVFLLALLEQLREEGHRTLVFVHYRIVLDILERILGNRGFKVLRLDGRIKKIPKREKIISIFEKDKRYSVFLLTTQVGGVGITLTAANRVVIYDPSWNPATDAQAVDRAYRIGQKENVVIYRLITCGTVEEKIYRRQVFKDSLIRQNTGDKKNPFRYFSRQELKELFTLEDPRSSTTQLQLQDLHSRHRRTDPALDQHIAQLHAMHMFGISDHDLMFSLDVNHDEGPKDQEEYQYIEGRVQKAQELVKAESEMQCRQRSDEKKPKNPTPRPSPPPPDANLNASPVVVDLDRSTSRREEPHQNLTSEVTNLSEDASIELMDKSSGAETSKQNAELECSHGDSNLVMADSDEDSEAAEAAEEEEQKLLSELQLNGSFDVEKSLSMSLNRTRASGLDESIMATKKKNKKRAAVINDSDEEEGQLNGSFLVLGSSTPKMSPPGSSRRRSRRSVGGNASVVSHRSLLQSVIEDVDEDKEYEAQKVLGMNSETEETDGETLDMKEKEGSEEDGELVLEEEDDGMETEDGEDSGVSDNQTGSTRGELQLEETSADRASSEDLEESSSEPELPSGDQMDPCAPTAADLESYEDLVHRGKKCYSPWMLLNIDPTWPGQWLDIRGDPDKKNPKHLKPVNSLKTAAEVELDPSGPETNGPQQDSKDQATDLSSSPLNPSADVGELMEKSLGTDDDNSDGLNRTSQSETGLDRLQEPDFSFEAEPSKEGPESEIPQGNAVLQLEESDDVQKEKLLSPVSSVWPLVQEEDAAVGREDSDANDEIKTLESNSEGHQEGGTDSSQLRLDETDRKEEENKSEEELELDSEEDEEGFTKDEGGEEDSEWETWEESEEDEAEEIKVDKTLQEYEALEKKEELEQEVSDRKAEGDVQVVETEEITKEEVQKKDPEEEKGREELSKEEESKETGMGEAEIQERRPGERSVSLEKLSKEEENQEAELESELEDSEAGLDESQVKLEESQVKLEESEAEQEESDVGLEESEAMLEELDLGLEQEMQENKSRKDKPLKDKFQEEESEDEKEEESAFITTSPNIRMKPADNPAWKSEPYGLSKPPETYSGQKKPYCSPPQQNNSLTISEVDPPGSETGELWLNLREQLMVLTLNDSADTGDMTYQTPGHDANLLLNTADDSSGLNRTSHSETGLDRLQEPDFSFEAEPYRGSAELETSQRSFKLQLEDSNDVQEEDEGEEQEMQPELQNRDDDEDDDDGRRSLLEGLQAVQVQGDAQNEETQDVREREETQEDETTDWRSEVAKKRLEEEVQPYNTEEDASQIEDTQEEPDGKQVQEEVYKRKELEQMEDVKTTQDWESRKEAEDDKSGEENRMEIRNSFKSILISSSPNFQKLRCCSSLSFRAEPPHLPVSHSGGKGLRKVQLGENLELSPEESGPKPEPGRQTSQELQTSSTPESKGLLNTEEEALNQSGSGGEEPQQNSIDQDIQYDVSFQEEAADVGRLMEGSLGSGSKLQQRAADDSRDVFISASQSEMDVDLLSPPHRPPSKSAFTVETSSLSAEINHLQQKEHNHSQEDKETDREPAETVKKLGAPLTDGSSEGHQERNVDGSGQVVECPTPRLQLFGRSPSPKSGLSQNSLLQTIIPDPQEFQEKSQVRKDDDDCDVDKNILPLTHKELLVEGSTQENERAGAEKDDVVGFSQNMMFVLEEGKKEKDKAADEKPSNKHAETSEWISERRQGEGSSHQELQLDGSNGEETPEVQTRESKSGEEHKEEMQADTSQMKSVKEMQKEELPMEDFDKNEEEEMQEKEYEKETKEEIQQKVAEQEETQERELQMKEFQEYGEQDKEFEEMEEQMIQQELNENDPKGEEQTQQETKDLESSRDVDNNDGDEKDTNKDVEISEWSSERRQRKGSSNPELQLHGKNKGGEELREEKLQNELKGNRTKEKTQKKVSEQEETQEVQMEESKSGEEDTKQIQVDMSQRESDKEMQKEELTIESFDEKEKEKIQEEKFEKETKEEMQDRVYEQEETQERNLKSKEFKEHGTQDKKFEEMEEQMIQEELNENDPKGEEQTQQETKDLESSRDVDNNADDENDTNKDSEISEWSSVTRQRKGSSNQERQLHGKNEGGEEWREEKIQDELKGNHNHEETQEEVSEQEETREVQIEESKSGEEDTKQKQVDMSQRESDEEMKKGEQFVENIETTKAIQEKMEENYIIEGEPKKEETRDLEWETFEEMTYMETEEGESKEQEEIQDEDVQGKETQDKKSDKNKKQDEELHMEDQQSRVLPSKVLKTLDLETQEKEHQKESKKDKCEERGMQRDEAQEKESEKHETLEQDLRVEMSEKMQEVATQEEEKGEEKVQENQAEEEESQEETKEDVPEEEKSEEKESEEVEMEHEEILRKEFNEELMEEKVDVQKDEAKMDESEETQEDEFKELQSEKESIEDESKEAGWQEEESGNEKIEFQVEAMNHLQNNLHESSLRADTPRVDPKFDSSNRIFVPKSQDADTEEQEGKLLSELQRNDSCDIEKSLTETISSSYNFSNWENSFMSTRKMRAAMNNEEQEDEDLLLKSLFTKPLGIHAASTPKSGNSVSSPRISKSRSGRKAWVSSCCSLLQFILKDADNQQVEDTGSDVDGGVSKLNSEATESVPFLTCNESQQNETTTESLKTEDEDKESDAIYTSSEDVKLLAEKKEMELEDRGTETSEAKQEYMICLVQDEEIGKEEMYEDSPIDLS